MLRLALMTGLILALATPAMAKGNADDQSDRVTATAHPGQNRDVGGAFSSAERNLIRAWLLETERHETASLPYGLQKKVARGRALPPGWQKVLVRGGHLDHGYYQQGAMLPAELLRRLPPPPPGSEILRIEDKIVRLDASTRIILDIFGLSGGH